MRDVLLGVKIVEVATWVFVPAGGAVLSDWGANVVKIEHPVYGDPQRGLVSASSGSGAAAAGFSALDEQVNRGKRSVAIDLGRAGGRELLYRMVEDADVFLTNFLPEARRRLGIDVEDLRAVNPELIYVRGSGQGVRGPDVDNTAFDGGAYWSRGGLATAMTPPELEYPLFSRSALGDSVAGLAVAMGVLGALLRRARTGQSSVVDVSLLGTALWQLFPDVVNAPFNRALYVDGNAPHFPPRAEFPNPVTNYYRSSDGRFLFLVMMEADRYWTDFCERIERPELVHDPRFANAKARAENTVECIRILDEVFAERSMEDWRERFIGLDAPWAAVQSALEVHDDPQVVANGYLRDVRSPRGDFRLVAAPVQFDETVEELTAAPVSGEHTEEVLLELGLDWEAIIAHKVANDIR